MKEPVTPIIGMGTISALTVVEVGAVSTTFAMVSTEGCSSRLAVRIGANCTAEGDVCFSVGDDVQYTLIQGAAGEPPRARDLMKSGTHRDAIVDEYCHPNLDNRA
ncbi:hypothetical protein PS862_04542 [Pseudomonas fluorescens]|uniref:Uncharacterized protein n=1 Tax=Pseudomonas fluorescens TaxID=294 RepID=A0A5E6XRL1_PSEFL|nr:hypothetical protein [Pseudomonas fluorescens]VVN43596.1 hypothetical protein PS639_05542 [Pseudomonas fluorescens]VVP34358.1 hypothetical protein PS862_04542 [Pseudomonas fluorescens]